MKLPGSNFSKGQPPDDGPTLDELREPAIWLRRAPGLNVNSRLGGLPSLPEGIAWPRQSVNGLPLHFLAQIDFSELPRSQPGPRGMEALPERGFAYFFADIEEEMLWGFGERGDNHAATRVIYSPTQGPLREPPDDAPDIGHGWGEPSGDFGKKSAIFSEVPIEAFIIDTFAGFELYFQGEKSKQADLLTLDSIARATGETFPVLSMFKMSSAERRLPAAIHEHIQDGNVSRNVAVVRHQMLGAAANVQGTAEEARGRELLLLLQLDSDRGVDEAFIFCDMGMVQYWITVEDLAAQRLDRAWATTEGG